MADMSRDEIWDDSTLIDTWNHALQEYKKYHSIKAKKGLQQTATATATSNLNLDEDAILVSAQLNSHQGQDEDGSTFPEEHMDEDIMLGAINQEVVHDEIPAPSADHNSEKTHQSSSMPPPPPFTLDSKDETLKNLMMSWYYAGYYTGLYEGQQKAAQSSSEPA